MSWLDIVILVPLLIGLIGGLMRGIISEIISIIAIIFGFLGAKWWTPAVSEWLYGQFAWPNTVCLVVAYAVLFLGIALILNIMGKLLSKLFQKIKLDWLNRLLGGIFGAAKWGLVVLAIVLCLHKLDKYFQVITPELKDQSVVYTKITPYSDQIWTEIKNQVKTNIKPQSSEEKGN